MQTELRPSTELARKNTKTFPNESAEYRNARNALIREEIELRRHIERVAQQRRGLPLGGELPEDYELIGEKGTTTLRQLFRDKNTLVVYNYMFGPQREKPCPMCTSFMGTFENKIQDIQQRISIAFIARSPIERLRAAKAERGWKHLPIYSDLEGRFTRDYVNADDADWPGYNVFTRREEKIYHFWGSEFSMDMADPGQDPRGAPDLDALWNLLDTTPEGRGKDWYPKLSY